MRQNGQRQSRGTGDVSRECQTVEGTQGNDWFVIWERGGKETYLGVRVDCSYPENLEDQR